MGGRKKWNIGHCMYTTAVRGAGLFQYCHLIIDGELFDRKRWWKILCNWEILTEGGVQQWGGIEPMGSL